MGLPPSRRPALAPMSLVQIVRPAITKAKPANDNQLAWPLIAFPAGWHASN